LTNAFFEDIFPIDFSAGIHVEMRSPMTLKTMFFILAGALLLTDNASAKIINVPGDYSKISDALGNADAGDTVKVRRGEYDENITLVMGVVLKGEDPLTTIIDGGRHGPTVMGTSGSEISHFTIRNGIEGVLCENAAPFVHHCWILDNHATGLAAFISLPNVRNNVIYGNRWSGILAWGAKSLDSKIEQNVVMHNGYSGLTLMGPTNIVARNNIFMENHFYGIFADPAAGQTKVEFNNIFKNYYPFNRFIKVNRTNISLDPKFINPSLSQPNFFVASRSPMIKRGKGKLDIGLLEKEEVTTAEEPEPITADQPEEKPSASLESSKNIASSSASSSVEEPHSFTLDGVSFESSSDKLTSDSYSALDKVVEQLKAFPNLKFDIVGYTDSQGNKQKLQDLSKQRADAVKKYLVSKGIAGDHLATYGKGPSDPKASNSTPDGRAKNRRIEFVRKN